MDQTREDRASQPPGRPSVAPGSRMSLAPEADNRTGAIALWVHAGDAERAIELVNGLGFPAA